MKFFILALLHHDKKYSKIYYEANILSKQEIQQCKAEYFKHSLKIHYMIESETRFNTGNVELF